MPLKEPVAPLYATVPAMRFRYQTFEFGETDIHVRSLRDRQQYDDVDGVASSLGISSATWPLFGVVWSSSEILAHLMQDYEVEGKRILEVGCGMALASLLLNHRSADITATDYHPEVEGFLIENVKLNQGETIPFVRAGWLEGTADLGKFDLIIGSDLLYEPDHPDLLSGFIEQHAHTQCQVIIIDPGRGLHSQFSNNMIKLGYSLCRYRPHGTDHAGDTFKGTILQYNR